MEIRVVRSVATLVVERLVDKMPITLPAHALAFDIVGKSGTFHKRMVALVLSEVGVVCLESAKLIESSRKSVRTALLKNGLSPARNKEMASAPPGVCLASDKCSNRKGLFHLEVVSWMKE